MKELKLSPTPLQQVLGFDVAEEIYDLLPPLAQLIIDLKIEGYRDTDISLALGIPRVTIIDTFRRTQRILLKSKMHQILENRVYYRETHYSVQDEED